MLSHTEKVKVFSKVGIEYDFSKLENYLFNTCGSSILTYLYTHSMDEFINELGQRDIKLNQRQQRLVDNYVKDCDFYIID